MYSPFLPGSRYSTIQDWWINIVKTPPTGQWKKRYYRVIGQCCTASYYRAGWCTNWHRSSKILFVHNLKCLAAEWSRQSHAKIKRHYCTKWVTFKVKLANIVVSDSGSLWILRFIGHSSSNLYSCRKCLHFNITGKTFFKNL